jgi:diguanylate cyclase (GGDEF)-like protein
MVTPPAKTEHAVRPAPVRVGPRRIWTMSGAFLITAMVVLALLPGDTWWTGLHVPWWLLLLAFYGGELLVVHLSFGRDAHTFSMSEVPLVIGLVAASPVALIISQLIANLAVLGGHRRQAPFKLAFNLSEYMLQTTVAVVVFRAVVDSSGEFTLSVWGGVIAATFVALASAHVMVLTAIRVTGGSVGIRSFGEAVAFSAGATLLNTILGLLVLQAMSSASPVVGLALLPSLVLFAAYRWFATSRQERARLKALYEATRDLHQSPQLETALTTAARHARSIFDAQVCEILLSPPGPGDVYRTMVGPGEHEVTMQRVPAGGGRSALDLLQGEPRAAIVGADAGLMIQVDHSEEPVAAAMVAPVSINEGLVGSVMVANHIGDIGVFEPTDLELLETLAAQVAVSVENGRLEDSLAALTELKEELKHQALHDSLTGLGNRTLFAERVQHALERAARNASRLAVLFLDLDDFKTINDSLGHAAGDDLLVAVGNRLRGHCRPDDTIARLGGDEFAVLLEEIAGVRDVTQVAERILDGLAAPIWIEGREVTIGVSIGIAFGGAGDAVGQVMRDADAAMYVAKRAGKHTFRLFEAEMHAEVVEQLQMRAELEAAADRGELMLEFQPIVDLTNGRVKAFEALVRWDHWRRGLLPPGQFIEFAEETGLIHRVGRWVLEQSLLHHRRFLDALGTGGSLEIAVNLSARQFEEPSFVDDIAKILGDTGIDPGALILEITETVVMNAPAGVIERLRDLGVKIAVDDFGTGYSSLAALDRLPVDILKVDRSFVQGMSREHDTSPLIWTIVGLSQWLGLVTVVEGIEEQWQADRLRLLGCDAGQGFLFSKPVGAVGALGLIRRQEEGETLYIAGDDAADRALRVVPAEDPPAAAAGNE